MSMIMRRLVVAQLTFSDSTQASDLLDPALTETDLIAMLARMVLGAIDGGEGFRVLVTSVRTDHSDDSQLGLHGHSRGYAIDLWPVDQTEMLDFLEHCAQANRWVTKIGLGGSSAQYMQQFNPGETLVFADNTTDHIHLQTD